MTIGRPPNILRPTKLTTYIPEDLRVKLDLYLYSEVEGRIPHGAYSRFLVERVKEFFERKPTLPLPLPTDETPLP